ncbi:glycerol-3-phosphate 1-O-acyltransferase PlsY [Weissella viridescens]|uniref:Glycerol-3-phosphate acyltransferase n=1 Tax=Weissella viridescens TaxID=1629 RepID=A0A0R2H1G0_WEIVI|nr:glycerol-3-phosphate 1-O-acyltransferase PlsY [Weissella viridescens]KRN46769.1 acyl-phosphate glycerol-3-phosphate acyltransferase [Weissella viridescens]MBX4172504.1 glycerol-3-phosphate 1-O-acyltransferase PlsY [Weissella viridescens]MCB6840783.1 glycerol-3-phosphate 1-O-acyltransferase PlsY [Weissella viridescens]MCB6847500.1 glycerol-3-phosphate 1-O-acyltransferase PlsY [Weissella viridescens]QOD86697.1 glycerol-3-phosphate 1-O-acyltransferase PlsY [Weissella viridescens]
MTLMHYLISLGLAYLIGSIPFGYIIGKVFFHKNLLKLGSGGIGTTNTLRNLGLPAGIIVLCLDVLKGSAGALMACLWGPIPADYWYFAVGVGAIIGHTYSVWIGFKGGKAVATSLGVLMVYSLPMVGIAMLAFGIAVFLTSMVSVGSMAGFISVTIAALLYQDWALFIVALILTIFVIYRHRGNLKRIKNGQENLIPFGLVYWAK